MPKTARRSQAERRRITRRALLDAAAGLFAERGYHAVSLDQIATRAGLTRGALHYNFAAKQDLLLGLLDERLAVRGEQVELADPADLAAAFPFDREFSLLFLEFAAAAARDPEVGRALVARLGARRQENAPAVSDLLGRAGIGNAPAEDLLSIVGAFVNGLSIEALAGAPVAELERLLGVMLRLLLAGLSVEQQSDGQLGQEVHLPTRRR